MDDMQQPESEKPSVTVNEDLPDYPDLQEETTEEVSAETVEDLSDEVVVSDEPEIETEEVEVVIEGEEEPQEDLVPAYAIKKQRRKLKAVKSENEQLKHELEQLKSQVGDITRGAKPDPLDYTDSAKFYEDLANWEKGGQTSEPQKTAPVQDIITDDELDTHYARASKLNGYEKREDTVLKGLTETFGDAGVQVTQAIIKESEGKSEMVMYALADEKRLNTFISKLQSDIAKGQNGVASQEANKYIWKLAEQANIKPKSKRVTAEPETIPQGRSDANSLESQISKAREKWQSTGKQKDFNAMKALQKKQKGMSNG